MGDLAKLIEDTIHDELLELHGPADIAEAVLAAIRERHVIVERAGEDSVEAAVDAVSGEMSCDLQSVRWILQIAAPILTAAARSAALEEAAKVSERVGRPVGAGDGDTYVPGTSADAARAIRALIGGTR